MDSETRLVLVEQSITRIEENTQQILLILNGKGDMPGLKGKVFSQASSLRRLWVVFSACTSIIIGLFVKVLTT